ncbi:cell wall hydrolase [Allosphingosinicella sp.]|jgi:hypothetical protein|uniref:cell wall hydrolase n=1 Tax=Allosphingosinicella sp. TaxID=2823234 RepID=UPI002EE4F8A2
MILFVRAARKAAAVAAFAGTFFLAQPAFAADDKAAAILGAEASAAPIVAHIDLRTIDADTLLGGPSVADVPVATPAPVPGERRELADLVREHSSVEPRDAQAGCLASAIYFESNGEPLAGQLAVAEVIINRARSGRFASTLCGVITQRSQFSFVRGGRIPTPPRSSAGWRTAVAVAHIAMDDLADSPVSTALFFHARYVSPGWRLQRLASVGNHIFYR